MDWPGCGHMAPGLGWIYMTCHWERVGSSRKVQMLMPKEGRQAAGWMQALMAFLKSPELLHSGPIFTQSHQNCSALSIPPSSFHFIL